MRGGCAARPRAGLLGSPRREECGAAIVGLRLSASSSSFGIALGTPLRRRVVCPSSPRSRRRARRAAAADTDTSHVASSPARRRCPPRAHARVPRLDRGLRPGPPGRGAFRDHPASPARPSGISETRPRKERPGRPWTLTATSAPSRSDGASNLSTSAEIRVRLRSAMVTIGAPAATVSPSSA